jgi:hypothetical protein
MTGDVEEDRPILEFEKYRNTIVNMIRGSKPSFSVGIYGD